MSASKFIRWLFVLLMFNAFSLASQTATAASDSGTLTGGSGGCGYSGYFSFWGMGSYSPTGLTGGTTLTGIYDYLDPFGSCSLGPGAWSQMQVTGFSGNPGSGWLNSVTCNGVTKTGASSSFQYASGTAMWMWGSIFNFITLTGGGTTGCTINHN